MSTHLPFPADKVGSTVFERPPQGIDSSAPASVIGGGLGATLYIPGSEHELGRKLAAVADQGAVASVVCLEDAISERQVPEAETNVTSWFRTLAETGWDHLPLLFLRPRTPEQLRRLCTQLGSAGVAMAGVSLPKFSSTNAAEWFDAVDVGARAIGHRLLVMPIIEGQAVLGLDTRVDELSRLRRLLDERRQQVPVVRIGGSDLCGLLGLRRRPDQTIYDLRPVGACIADLVTVLAASDDGFTVAGPVWEYFPSDVRVWKPQLRQSLFRPEPGGLDLAMLRSELLDSHLDGLIKEVWADQANGLSGKTIIHPSHVAPVNALQAVTFEEWVDARSVDHGSRTGSGGATRSVFANKMNETAPHRRWATRVLDRADAFGVLAEGHTFVSLLG